MKGQELKNIRQQMGLERSKFARLLGYTGTDRNNVTRIRQYERGGRDGKQIPLYIARLVWLLAAHHSRTRSLPEFPQWTGYDYISTPDPDHQKDKEKHGFY